MKTLTFNEVNFSPVELNGQIWLTASELATAIGYKNKQSISKLYNSNADEFSSSMTQIVESTESVLSAKTKGLRVKIRIFSLRGCHLIAMFARTKVAKEFRKWVLDILDKEMGQPIQINPISTIADRRPLNDAVKMYCSKTGAFHGEAWKLVHQRFNLESVHDMTIEQVPQAVEYVHSLLILALQKPSNVISDGALMNNRMWADVGFVKTEQVCQQTRELASLLSWAVQKVNEIRHCHSTIFDSFNEQKWTGLTPEQLERVHKQGSLFLK